MLKDIAAMANHQGGDIYVGVDEDEDAVATALPGVSGTGHVERIRSSCLSNIAPRLNGLQVRDVPLQNGNNVIVVRVPRSQNGPHLITYRGLNQFWKRHGRQKDKMSADEIRTAFLMHVEAETKLERFVASRRERLASQIGNRGWLLLTITPQFLDEEQVDVSSAAIRRLLSTPPPVGRFGRSVGCGSPLPTLWGLRCEDGNAEGIHTYLELHRTGHAEFGSSRCLDHSLDHPGQIPSVTFLEYLYSLVHLFEQIISTSAISPPMALGASILNARGLTLAVSRSAFSDWRDRAWPEAVLEMPLVYSQDLTVESGPVMKRINDRLWNAFGFQSCSLIDALGELDSSL